MSALVLPRRNKGRQSAAAIAAYETQLESFCTAILEIKSRLDFEVSSRGWAYILEEYGLGKGDFDAAEGLIRDCWKSGRLPLDITATDSAREFEGVRYVNDNDPEEQASAIIRRVSEAHQHYFPESFWDYQDCYLQMMVEKIDLKSLFLPICREFHVPVANARGWSDLHSRAEMMARFRDAEAEGKRCVLLYCGDHDPAGLSISDFLRSNMADLSAVVGWSPDNLKIDRFGLNHEFIEANRLTWIDGLETGSGGRLDDPRHADHGKPYVQSYLAQFGARKVEANALVVRPDAGRQLCRDAIARYINPHGIVDFEEAIEEAQEALAEEVARQMVAKFGGAQ
jgi:hypothetical protein